MRIVNVWALGLRPWGLVKFPVRAAAGTSAYAARG